MSKENSISPSSTLGHVNFNIYNKNIVKSSLHFNIFC
jgi:hypothetical protein